MNLFLFLKRINAFLLTILLSLGLFTSPPTDNPMTSVRDDCEAVLSMALVSDMHIGSGGLRAKQFALSLEDIANAQMPIDVLVVPGDLTENGTEPSYRNFFDVMREHNPAPHSVIATGNHDVRTMFNRNRRLFTELLKDYTGIDTQGKLYYDYEVNGISFIVLGTDKQSLERAVIGNEQLEWFDLALARATQEGKPAFVICHQPLKNTHGLPDVWPTGDVGKQSDALLEIMSRYDNVFYVSGHLHDCVNETRVEELQGVHLINVPSVIKMNDEEGYTGKGLGFIMEVFEDEVVLRARDHFKGSWIDGFEYHFDIV